MRGRKPKPLGVQLAEGDPRAHGMGKLREMLACEPQGERGLQPCPSRLKGLARKAWKSWAEQLTLMGLDHRIDAAMLEGACVAFARATEADEMIAKSGPLVKSGDSVVPNPAIGISQKSWLLFHRLASELGMSPISRTRLAVGRHEKPEDDLLKILSQPRPEREAVQ